MSTSSRNILSARDPASLSNLGDYDPSNSYLDRNLKGFMDAGERYQKNVDDSIVAMGQGDTSNPRVLAEYQKASAMWTMQLSAQSSFVKNVKDAGMTIIHNFN
jgi:type III secretion apparatus needle protein